MVIRPDRRENGWVMADLVMAMGMFVLTMLPLTASFVHEQKLCRIYYYQALAMELIDGEFEALLAGDHNQFQAGMHPYPVKSMAATNLPPGDFVLTKEAKRLRLEWLPKKRGSGGRVFREAEL